MAYIRISSGLALASVLIGVGANWTVLRAPTDQPDSLVLIATESRQRVLDVRDFGAKGDGINDDRPKIQAAIDEARRHGGGTVYLPEGTYLLNSVQEEKGLRFYLLDIPSHLVIKGAGESRTILKCGHSMPDQTRIVSAFGNEQTPVENVGFEDFTLDGSAGQQPNARSMVGISMVHTKNILHRHVTVKNVKGTKEDEGANFDSFFSTFNTYIDCTALTTSAAQGSTGSGFSATESRDVGYLRCHSYNSGWWMGLTTFKSAKISYRKCTAAGNHQRGFNAELSENIRYDQCISTGTSTNDARIVSQSWDGFYAFRSQGVLYSQSLSEMNRGSGVFNNGSSGVIIKNSVLRQNGSAIGVNKENDCENLDIASVSLEQNRNIESVLHPEDKGLDSSGCKKLVTLLKPHIRPSGANR